MRRFIHPMWCSCLFYLLGNLQSVQGQPIGGAHNDALAAIVLDVDTSNDQSSYPTKVEAHMDGQPVLLARANGRKFKISFDVPKLYSAVAPTGHASLQPDLTQPGMSPLETVAQSWPFVLQTNYGQGEHFEVGLRLTPAKNYKYYRLPFTKPQMEPGPRSLDDLESRLATRNSLDTLFFVYLEAREIYRKALKDVGLEHRTTIQAAHLWLKASNQIAASSLHIFDGDLKAEEAVRMVEAATNDPQTSKAMINELQAIDLTIEDLQAQLRETKFAPWSDYKRLVLDEETEPLAKFVATYQYEQRCNIFDDATEANATLREKFNTDCNENRIHKDYLLKAYPEILLEAEQLTHQAVQVENGESSWHTPITNIGTSIVQTIANAF